MLTELGLDSKVRLHTGRDMPRLGFGSGGLKGEDGVEAVSYAMKTGYLMVDTAQMYQNEDARDQRFICTKWQPPPEGSDLRPSPEEVRDQAKESVLKLDRSGSGKEYLDLMIIHHPRPDPDGRVAFWEGLAMAQREGWVKDIGVSNFNVAHLEALPGPKPAVNQIELHPWCQQRAIVEYCRSKGIILQAFCPLVRIRPDKFGDPVVVRIAKKHNKGVSHILLSFVPIPKASSPSRIDQNKDLYDFVLDEQDMKDLDGLDQGSAGRVSGIDPDHLPK
ncbi:hypothetical protein IAU60_003039 [Kwoniella sp. DSM 27419]